MRIFVCGANGQLGRELSARAARHGHVLTALEHKALDITDGERVSVLLADLRPELVINAAAYTRVDQAESCPEAAFAVNAEALAHLGRAAAAIDAPLFHISTDYVFAGDAQLPYRECDPPAPQGVYGASKLAGEQALQELHARHVILRTSWVFSAFGNNFVKTMLRLGAEREALSVVDDQIGCPTHAGALADALLQMATRYAQTGSLPWGLYHYSGTPACSWYDFAAEVFNQAVEQGLLARAPRLSPISTADYPTPARRPAWSVLDCSLFEQSFGIDIRPWRDGLAEMLAMLAGEQQGRA